MTDIVLEVIQAIVLLAIVAFVWNAGRSRFEQSRTGWVLILAGFGLITIGIIIDVADEFASFTHIIRFGDTEFFMDIGKFVVFLSGFVLLAMGFWIWIPKVQALSNLVDTRTWELQETNASLVVEIENRRQAEAVLRQSEERFRSLTANTNIIPWEADATTFQFTYVGPQAEHHLGYPVEDWYRHDFWPDHLHPDDKEMAIANCMTSLERVEDSDFEYRMIAADGRTVWLRDFVNVVVNKDGQKILRGILANITNRKIAEVALKESEERHRALVECASDAFFLHDQYGKLIEVNDAACQSLGYERDDLLTKHVSDFEQGVDPAMLRRTWAGMADGQAITVQGEHNRKDGSRFPVEARVSLLTVNGDKRFLALVRDMTDRRQAELAVRESEEKYRTLVETSHDLIWSVDVAGRFTFVNQASRAIHGYEPEEMIGRRFTDFMTEEQAKKDMAVFADIKGGRIVFDLESIHQKKDGTPVYLSFNAVVMRDADGEVIGTRGTAKDISDRVRADEIARLHQTELAHVTRVSTMGEMATSLAHELNQPLTATMNFIDGCLLRLKIGEPASPQIIEALEKASHETHRAGDIIRRLRTFIGKVEQKIENVSINDAVRVVVDMVQPELRQHRIDLRLDLEENDPVIAGDRILTQQVILNLVRNAMEALQKVSMHQRKLAVSTAENAGEITLVVSDNGPGVAAERIDPLFQPFNTNKEGGLGLGLAISRSVIESLGGQIWYAPTAEHGAVFNIRFPTAALNQGVETKTRH